MRDPQLPQNRCWLASADLRGEPQHAKQIPILAMEHHQLPQRLPLCPGYLGRNIQFEQVDRLAFEITDSLLAQQRQVESTQPVTRKQQAIVIQQKLLPAVHKCRAGGRQRIQQGGLPAQAHQAATGMPSARTLSLARSSTCAREASRRSTAPPSR